MSSLHILTHEGDKTVVWDHKKAESGDAEALAAVREAERIFEEARRRGATAFVVDPGLPSRVLERFDPMATKIIMVPRVQGG